MTSGPEYRATPTGYLMVLREGADVFARLDALMRQEDISSATVLGFGFLRRVTFGFFDFDQRDYMPRSFENLELTNLTGTLAWKDGAPSIHAHGSAGGPDFALVGGHLLGLEVGRGSVELTVIVHGMRLERETDPAIGANVLRL